MIQQTIDELRNMLNSTVVFSEEDTYTIHKAIIACEQLRKARKKAKRWKRKYQTLVADYDEYCKDAWKGGAEC